MPLERKQAEVPLDGLGVELWGRELQLLQSFPLGLQQGRDGGPLQLMLTLLVQRPLLQQQGSPLTLLIKSFTLVYS